MVSTLIVSEAFLTQVSVQVRTVNAHVRPLDASLEQCPKVFNTIYVNVTVDKFLCVVN